MVSIKNSKKALFLLFLTYSYVSFSQTKEQLEDVASYSFEIYKTIHAYPELGKEEHKTSKLIKNELLRMGYTEFFTVPNLPTCVMTVLDSGREGPSVVFRADIDARPGKENTGLAYSSKIDSVHHSCGHDAHTAILLGTAKLLYEQKKQLNGKMYFLFQPAEETKGGADDIVNSGLLKKLEIDYMYALHAVSHVPVGNVTVSPGYIMAGSNYFTVEIEGKSSHAATPHLGSNVPVLTSKVIETITAIPATRIDVSSRPSVISVTYIESGKEKASNIIPSRSVIKGTIRAYEPIDVAFKNQPSIKEILTKEINSLCSIQDAAVKIEIIKGSPPTHNNVKVFNSIIPKLSRVFSGTIDTSPFKGMFSEDFAYYTESVPCLYFGLGVAKNKLGYANVHTSEFSVHPDAFIYGIELFSRIALIK